MDSKIPSPPDFNKMLWRCPCCDKDRPDRYIKVYTHDLSSLHEMETGTFFINVKYCIDTPECKDKAFDRDWVIKKFFPNR